MAFLSRCSLHNRSPDSPAVLQNSRVAMLDERNEDGLPRVHATCSGLNIASAMNGPPTAFWHIRQ